MNNSSGLNYRRPFFSLKKAGFLCFGLFFIFRIAYAQDFIQAPAAIHISSRVSDGKLSIPEIIKIARQNEIKIVITTDRDLMRWEYGIWPFRNLVKKTVEDNSIFRFGIKRYLALTAGLQRINRDVLLVLGIESAPYYYWQGSFIKRTMRLRNWHKHFLVFGLDNAKDIDGLPVIGNPRGLRGGIKLSLCWPLILLAFGAICMKKRKYNYKDLKGRPLGPFHRVSQVVGLCAMAIGLLFSINNWPFRAVIFDQYGPDRGIMPYQNFITYVGDHGGLTFWAHPEAKNVEWFGSVKTDTKEHALDLLAAIDYTGFAVFYEGYNVAGVPGGIWDETLMQYCKGIRKKPVFALAGLSFDSSGNLAGYMKDVRTVLLLRNFSDQEALKSLREGRMYASRGKFSSQFVLDTFVVKPLDQSAHAIMGQEIKVKGTPSIEISGHFSDGQEGPVTVRLIKNGKTVQSFRQRAPFTINYEDQVRSKERKDYYRIEVESEGLLCVSNPIFMLQNTI